MMRFIISSCLFLLLFTSCYQQERNCADFKTGEFEFTYTLDGEEKTSRFVRNDTLEVDYFEDKVDSNSVRWINDCEFIVKKLNPTSAQEAKAIHMKILTTSKKTYTFEYSVVGDKTNKQKGIATKID
ncbi:hypothetical protein OOZ15_09505 [Galbibacter sp. EGI 63066]|uniref:hypothetical protein n=1 Tax=Galbibacter sp. EGI 63066 TaxID=2993559 RepID=UPI0022487A11|nr:hypothetical protein [Galbibacter sp. EGI 63066]MCX2680172.1 hypothetical protein [Galbibacter sp. EGI 63066]